MRAVSGTISAQWNDYSTCLGFSWGANQALPRLSLEATARWAQVELRGAFADMLTSSPLETDLGIHVGQTIVSFGTAWALESGVLASTFRCVDMTLSPLADVLLGGRVSLNNAGTLLWAFNASARTPAVSAAYEAEWDTFRNFSAGYSLEFPYLLLGVRRSVRMTPTEKGVTTSWYPLLPHVPELPTQHAALPSAPRPTTPRQGQFGQLQDSQCPVCAATGGQARSADDTLDFGEVMVGETVQRSLPLGCGHHIFCWLDEILAPPQPPFEITYAPIGLTIPLGEQRYIQLDFTPATAGRCDSTMTLRYCFATWREDEDLPLAGEIGAVGGHYVAQCIIVTIALTGVALAKPEAHVTFLPDSPVCGQDVRFDGSESVDPNPGGAITSYEWDFGDDTRSSDMRPSHRYSHSGTYNATLTVWNNREMVSDPCRVVVDVAPDLIEAAVVAGAAVAAGLATEAFAMAPPLLAAAVSGSVLAVATIVHELDKARFPIDQLVVRFPDSWDQEDVQLLIQRNIPGGRVIGYFSTLNAFLIQVPVGGDSAAAAAAELDAIQERLARVLPYGAQLGKNYIGLFEGTAQGVGSRNSYDLEALDADLRVAYDAVRAPEAWRRISGAGIGLSPVRIAVVDSGIYANHEEFIIPLRGRSYIVGDNGTLEPWYEDATGHGTQVSGIIGAENGRGRMNGMLSGTAGSYEMQAYRVVGDMFSVWDCLRIAVSTAQGELETWKTAVEAAVRRESVVVNVSVGWDLDALSDNDRVLARNTFLDLLDSYPGTLFVSSAGNGDNPEDLPSSTGRQLTVGGIAHAPGGIAASNNLTVAATNSTGTELASWSNYGSAVDIAAPGEDVYTTDSDGTYTWRVEGSSYAAAMVTGAAAAVLAIDPKLTPQGVKEILLASPTRVSAPDGTTIPVLDFADAVRRAIESHLEHDRQAFWWSAGVALGALVLGLLILSPF